MFFWWRWIFPSRWLTQASFVDFTALRRIPDALFSAVFPDDCGVCGKPLTRASRIPVCPPCLRSPQPFIAGCFCSKCNTPFINAYPLDESGECGLCRRGLTRFDAAIAFGEYEGTLRKLIHLFKYGKVRTLDRPLGALLLSALPRDMRFDAIVPMPLHWSRRWTRGFNQSQLLAAHVADKVSLPLLACMRRTKRTETQAGLSNAQRRGNVSGAFVVPKRSQKAVEGRHLLLIDDVFTTGATANAAASVLKRAGAARVTILTLARVDRRFAGGKSLQFSDSFPTKEPT